MSAATSTTFDALLRELWSQDDIYDLIFKNRAFFAMVPKDTSFYEKIRHVPVGVGTTQGVSADYAAAKANRSGSVAKEFKVTPVTMYSFFNIQRQLLRRAQNKKAAILPALERESKMAIEAWGREMGYLIWGNGGGAITQAITISTNTIVLPAVGTPATYPDARKFAINQVVEFASDDGTGGAGVRAGKLKVTGVNPGTGTITFDQNVTTGIPGATANDYVFRQGNYANVVTGVDGWVPSTDPTNTAFFGMDRSVYPTMLGGLRVDATGRTPREAAQYAAKMLFEVGAEPTHYFLSTDDLFNLQLDLQASGALLNIKEPAATIGKYSFGIPFDGLQFMGPAGPVKCFADINCPSGVGRMTQLDTWKFASMGDVPYFDMEDGNKILKETDADSYGAQIVGDCQLYNEAPGYTARVKLT